MGGRFTELQLLLITVAVVLVAVLGLGVLIYFGHDQLKTLKADAAEKGRQIKAEREREEQMRKMQREIELADEQVKRFEQILPNRDDRDQFYVDVGNLLKAVPAIKVTGFRWVDAQAAAGAAKRDYREFQFQLPSVEGNVFAFGKLLDFVESWDRFIKIDTFSLNRLEEREGTPGKPLRLGGQLNLLTYAFGDIVSK